MSTTICITDSFSYFSKKHFMPEGYKIRDQFAMHFLIFQIVQWVDIFTRPVYRDIVVDSFNYCVENKGLRVFAWVIMSNHLHCILSSHTGELSKTVGELKRHTSKNIYSTLKSSETKESRRQWAGFQFEREATFNNRNNLYQVWTQENHPMELITHEFTVQKINYIHNNPVRVQIVECPEHYLYSSARDYSGYKGLIKMELLNLY